MENTHHFNAIGMNLQMLSSYLSQAQGAIDDALIELSKGNQSGVVGALLYVPDLLDNAGGLYRAIIAIHRNSRTF